jgi:hypothetical protein
MTGTGEAGQTRLPGRVSRTHRREHDMGHHPRRDDRILGAAGGGDDDYYEHDDYDEYDEPDEELDAVNRLMGFLRRGNEQPG